jgi:hypothetical protein
MLPQLITDFHANPHTATAITALLNPGCTVADGLSVLHETYRVLDIDDWAAVTLQLHFNFDLALMLHSHRHVHYVCWYFGWDDRSLDEIAADEGLSDGNVVHRRGPPAMKLFLSVLLTCLRTQLRKERYDLVLARLNQVFKFPTWQNQEKKSASICHRR